MKREADDVICVTVEEPLRVLYGVVHDARRSRHKHNLAAPGVHDGVACIVPSVAARQCVCLSSSLGLDFMCVCASVDACGHHLPVGQLFDCVVCGWGGGVGVSMQVILCLCACLRI